ncbi:hypothetical protein DITRI_Ditri20bG0052100 [Diplodiscus trichospermus]
MAVVLERKRQKKRLMGESLRAAQVALWEKDKERSTLKRKKQRMLAKEAAKKKLVDDFMVFIGALKSNDLENTQKFDEKAMMSDILNMMKSDYRENGGFAGGSGGSNVTGSDLGLVEKAIMDAVEALVHTIATCGDDNGGFAGCHGGISDAAESANNLVKEGLMTPTEGTSSDGGEGSNTGGYDGGNRRN